MGIDYDYVIHVADYTPELLPRPDKKLLDNDGTLLPLISVKVDLW